MDVRRSRRLWAMMAGLVVFPGLATACSSAQGSSGHGAQGSSGQASASLFPGVPKTPTTIRVIWQPSGEFDYYYATSHHIWARFGLKVQPIKIITGVEELSAMASNSADIAYMGLPPGITGLSHSINMVAVTSGPDEAKLDGLYVSPKSGITSIKGAVGKTIGTVKDSTADVDMNLALKAAGIPESSVHVKYMEPQEMGPALQRGEIQGAFIWDAWGQRLVQAGNKLIIPSSQLGVADAAEWWVQESFLAKHRDAVARFIAALAYSAKRADASPSNVVAEYSQIAGLSKSEALTIAQHQPALTINDLTSATGPLSFFNQSTGIQHTANLVANALVTLGDLPSAPSDLSSHIDSQPMHAAVKLLNKIP